MAAHQKLTREQIRLTQEELRCRHAMLLELSEYTLKRIAGRRNVHVETIRRIDYAMYGKRAMDRNVQLLARKIEADEAEDVPQASVA